MWLFIWLGLGSALFFLIWGLLCGFESRQQRRLFAPRFRGWLDAQLQTLVRWGGNWTHYIARYMFTLGWYYSLHKILKTGLQFVANIYFVLEHLFESNRARTKQLRREQRQSNPFFSELTNHKTKVELSSSKKKSLKQQALDGK